VARVPRPRHIGGEILLGDQAALIVAQLSLETGFDILPEVTPLHLREVAASLAKPGRLPIRIHEFINLSGRPIINAPKYLLKWNEFGLLCIVLRPHQVLHGLRLELVYLVVQIYIPGLERSILQYESPVQLESHQIGEVVLMDSIGTLLVDLG
jgi:hypothetical protein